jgi:hypothetical protein
MEVRIDEIGTRVFRLSVFVPEVAPPAGFTFNHFLILGDEPLLFHCGGRKMFPLVSGAVAKIIPIKKLRWLTFGHFEADECGSMNEWLAASPQHSLPTAWLVAVFRSPIWLTDHRASSRMERLSISVASASVISTRRMSHMAGMLVFYLRRQHAHFSAGTCSLISVILPHLRRVISLDQLWPSKTSRTQQALGRQRRLPFASWPNSNRPSWPPCTAHHFPVMEPVRLKSWAIISISVYARHSGIMG